MNSTELVIKSSKEVTIEKDLIHTGPGVFTVKIHDEVFYVWYKDNKEYSESRFSLLDNTGKEIDIIGITPRLNGLSIVKNHIRDAFISYMIGKGQLIIKVD